MTTLSTDLTKLFVRELTTLKSEIEMFPDDESIWRTLPGITNSAGNLAMHLAGGLQHFVGALLGGTGYVRDRPKEFSQKTATRHDVLAEIDRAIHVVQEVLPRVPAARLEAPFPEKLGGGEVRTGLFLTHLAVHAGFHLGQVGYLRRALLDDNRSTSPLPLAPLTLAAHNA